MSSVSVSFLRRVWKPSQRLIWKPLVFPRGETLSLPADQKIEEENLPDFKPSRYHPVYIGDIFQDRYQIVGKLGFGMSSTVWLARDLSECRHVTLKMFVRSEALGNDVDRELDVFRRILNIPKQHPGHNFVRTLLDSFEVDGPNGRHRCLVHKPLWESVRNIKNSNEVGRLPTAVLALILKNIFIGLELLHDECHVVHTDIKEANILLEADSSVLESFERDELERPSPRKEVGGHPIYASRELGIPNEFGTPVLCDFGTAIPLDDGREHREDIQPDVYRAPEIILDIPWSYSVDIWNIGCMVWDSFEGGHLFGGHDPEVGKYRGRAHLAEMIALLGPPPPSLLARANLRSKFFSDCGEWNAGIPILPRESLEDIETTLLSKGDMEDRKLFLQFMRKMLQWEPEKRARAKDLARDEWIVKHT